jgi:hypothetical protein
MPIVHKFIREAAFDSKINSIAKDYRRMHELDLAIEWGLQRNPKQFYNIREDFYLWKTDRLIDDVPQLRILYRFDEKEATVYLIEADEIKD